MEILQGNAYPGRGMMIGLTPDGTRALCAYFIMGRSDNSRNRIFVLENGILRTQAFDESLVEDPSLIIYRAVLPVENWLILANGDQSETILSGLAQGLDFKASLDSRTFEPDAPHYTPRISGLATRTDGHLSYTLSILKSAEGRGEGERRCFYDFKPALAGEGHFISTYAHDGSPLPSFSGEPRCVSTMDDLDAFTDALWQSLNKDNRISLYTCTIDLATGVRTDRLRNRHLGD
ncbi:MAG: IMP cyclohydrolase [Lachnospiraceae bacterium]|nr:IMP cyclohydrolase [Lachnospiraceae bacterium]